MPVRWRTAKTRGHGRTGARQWVTATVGAALTLLVLGLPAVLIPNGIFAREIDPTWWSYPVWVATAVLSGLLFATYTRPVAEGSDGPGSKRGLGAEEGGGHHQHVGVREPPDSGRGGVQLDRQRGQGDVHDREVGAEDRDGQRERGQRPPPAGCQPTPLQKESHCHLVDTIIFRCAPLSPPSGLARPHTGKGCDTSHMRRYEEAADAER